MDIFISNVPPRANHTELRLFLRDIVQRFDILAFDILKKTKTNWAILTTADSDNAQRFLQTCGGFAPLNPLYFKQSLLRFQKSKNNAGQPDSLKVRVLMEKEFAMRAKRSKQPYVSTTHASQPIFPFSKMQTGVWGYDSQDTLTFDSKYKDMREGTISFGRSALVVYLAAAEHHQYRWHCRIDVPYGIIEHAVPSDDNGLGGTIVLTLKSPPKIYRIEDTEDLHLYTGAQPVEDPIEAALRTLNLKPKTQRLVRETSVLPHLDRNSALCMVYRFVLPEVSSAQRAWIHISKSSALSRSQVWRSMVPSRDSLPIETQYKALEKELDSYDYASGLNMSLTFAVRFQLLALVLEGTLAPTTMLELIPHVQIVGKHYGPELVARGVRKLQYQIPTPGPDVDAKELGVGHIVSTLAQNIRDFKVRISEFYRCQSPMFWKPSLINSTGHRGNFTGSCCEAETTRTSRHDVQGHRHPYRYAP